MNRTMQNGQPGHNPNLRSRGPAVLAMLAGLVGAAVTAPAALGQAEAAPAAAPAVSVTQLKREALQRLTRPITVSFQEQRLEDVIRFLEEYSGTRLEARWADARTIEGMDPEALVTLRAEQLPILTVLERVLNQAQGEFTQNTWQFTEWGTVEIGPKEALNRSRRVELYDINDLLLEIPDYPDAPELDLASVLQSGQGGGGQSPFQENQRQQRDQEEQRRRQKADEIIDLLQSLVEPEQWIDNGGNGGSMRFFQGAIIVNAPDYMHRQLAGYSFWPAQRTRMAMVEGRRYVSFTVDTSRSKVDGFAQHPVTAVVGGQLVPSGPGAAPGGGGSTAPQPGGPD